MSPGALALLALAALASSAGCSQALRCPSSGGPPWWQVESEHFSVRTDLDQAEARLAVVDMERVRAALLAAAWQGAPTPPGRLSVVLLRDASELGQFAAARVRGFVTRDLIGQRFMVLQAADAPESGRSAPPGSGQQTLKHELAHVLADAFLLRQPRWLAEGLATFLQTIRLDEPAGRAVLGEPPSGPLGHLIARGPIASGRVLGWDRLVFTHEAGDLYATSWLLVHWLLFERGAQFGDFQRRLMRADDPAAAFAAAFPGLSEADLDRELSAHLRQMLQERRAPTFSVPLQTWDGAVQAQRLEDAEVHATWATLYLVAPGPQDTIEREKRADPQANEALRLAPTNVTALLATRLLTLPLPERLRRVREAAQAHPDDWRAQSALARVLEDAPGREEERDQVLRRAVELSPDNPRALAELARSHLRHGRPQEALAMAARAAQLAPGSALLLDTLAAALAGAGRCADALKVQRRAVDVLPHDEDEPTMRALTRHLDELSRRCEKS